MSAPSRRDALKGLGLLAGAAATGCGASEAAPNDADTAASDTAVPDTGTASPGTIDTHVILMMENRSFDHYFGSLTLDEGRTDVDGLRADMVNLDGDGKEIHPFHLEATCVEDPPHGWSASREQFNGGKNDGFVLRHAGGTGAVAHEAMGYLKRADLPVYYALADDHTVCDRWFASVLSSTWPNRIYAYTATSNGMPNNDFSKVPFEQDNIFDRLTTAGVSWAVYYHAVPFAGLLGSVSGNVADGHVKPIEDYFADAKAGRLPSVCFIEPGYTTNDDHPPHAPMLGQALVAAVYQALADSPHWERCMMVVDYDEHGGFFDHVAPPTVPDEYASEGFDQLGFRVPALVISPYSKTGSACSTQLEHTSVLKHLAEVYGMDTLTQRDAAANPLWDCLDLDRMAANDPKPPTTLPVLDISMDQYGNECFFLVHPGQWELDEMAERGTIPAVLDRRSEAGEIVDRVMLAAQRLGVVRFKGR